MFDLARSIEIQATSLRRGPRRYRVDVSRKVGDPITVPRDLTVLADSRRDRPDGAGEKFYAQAEVLLTGCLLIGQAYWNSSMADA